MNNMTSKDERREQARRELKAAGDEYEAARSSMNNARTALEPYIVTAAKEGVEPWELQQLSHLSAMTVRNIRHAAGLGEAPRGGRPRRPKTGQPGQ